jgi:hypothetical protein
MRVQHRTPCESDDAAQEWVLRAHIAPQRPVGPGRCPGRSGPLRRPWAGQSGGLADETFGEAKFQAARLRRFFRLVLARARPSGLTAMCFTTAMLAGPCPVRSRARYPKPHSPDCPAILGAPARALLWIGSGCRFCEARNPPTASLKGGRSRGHVRGRFAFGRQAASRRARAEISETRRANRRKPRLLNAPRQVSS